MPDTNTAASHPPIYQTLLYIGECGRLYSGEIQSQHHLPVLVPRGVVPEMSGGKVLTSDDPRLDNPPAAGDPGPVDERLADHPRVGE